MKKKRTYEEFLADALVPEEEWPHPIPETWRWVRLGEVSTYESNSVQPAKYPDKIFELYSVPSFQEGYPEIVPGNEIGSSKQGVQKGDVLLCKINPRINRVWRVTQFTEHELCASSEWIVIRNPHISPEYLVHALSEEHFRNLLTSNVSGVGGSLTRAQPKQVKTYPLPLPPLAEQQVIAKVLEEAFDRLDEAREHLEAVVEGADYRRASLLHKAMTGELSAAFRAEHPEDAGDLLESIREERAALVKAKKLKKTTFDPLEEEDIPYPIPETWSWVRLGEVAENIQYGYSAKAKEQGDARMVRITDIQHGCVHWDEVPFCDIEQNKVEKYLLKEADLLFARTGGTVGKSFLVRSLPYDAIYAGYLVRLRVLRKMSPLYLYYFMQSGLYWLQLREGTISTAQPNFNAQKLANMAIPLPPLAEQQVIAEHLEELFEKEEEMVKRAKETLRILDLMKKSLLARAFRGELAPQSSEDVEELLERIYEEAR